MTNTFFQPVVWVKHFVAEEVGAVTVDWVVLTASTVGLAMLVISYLAPAIFVDAGVAISERLIEAAARP